MCADSAVGLSQRQRFVVQNTFMCAHTRLHSLQWIICTHAGNVTVACEFGRCGRVGVGVSVGGRGRGRPRRDAQVQKQTGELKILAVCGRCTTTTVATTCKNIPATLSVESARGVCVWKRQAEGRYCKKPSKGQACTDATAATTRMKSSERLALVAALRLHVSADPRTAVAGPEQDMVGSLESKAGRVPVRF